ncbi:MAG TPA: amidophosphoribosyltransferase [bacterium]|nr:amidophosphoribosyltransferase [bacterium]
MSGIFGVVSHQNCRDLLFYGTDYHSHLGTQFAGMAVLGKGFSRQIHSIAQSHFKSKFFEDSRKMEGDKGIGVVSASDEQPIYLHSKVGPYCIVTNGQVQNRDQLSRDLMKKGISFSEFREGQINTTELVAKLISQGDNLLDGIDKMFNLIEGSCSLLLLNEDGVYAARDRLGYSPLVIGQRPDALAVTSETCAFPNLGLETVKFLEPGEIVLINKTLLQKRPGSGGKQICTFLWIYTGFPSSDYEGINAESVRERCGQFLARRDKDIEADMVSGVPSSGIGHGLGYAMESGKPFRRPLEKYTPGYGRSYIPLSQETRDFVAKMKLIPNRAIIQGNRIVVCEDSIVRGTQLKNFTIRKFWDCGAKEIHIRAACPPLMFPCRFNVSTRDIEELAARRAIRALEGQDVVDLSDYLDPLSEKYKKMVDWICRDLEVTTLRYQTLDDMVAAVGLPREHLCLYCWTGQCPEGSCAACGASKP